MMTETIQIQIEKIEKSKLEGNEDGELNFGKVFTDHMFIADFKDGEWGNIKITPFADLQLSPATSFIHYGQSIFEGLKAFHGDDGINRLFRPMENIRRFNKSAVRMCMPEFPEALHLHALKQLLKL